LRIVLATVRRLPGHEVFPSEAGVVDAMGEE
jgi:hypothetical protein